MSSLRYLNDAIAEVECQNVRVEQVVGSYRLLFELNFVPMSWDGGQVQGYVPYLTSLRLVVKLNDILVGTAFPKEEDFLTPMHPQARNAPSVRRTFALDIDPRVLDGIEQERSERDISFQLEVLGTGTVFALREANFQSATSLPKPLGVEPLFFEPYMVKADIHYQIPQSDWIKLLDQMNYARTLLFEIPWPKGAEEGFADAVSHFESARAAFLSGSYKEAVIGMRDSLESIRASIERFKHPNLKRLLDQGPVKDMQLQERFFLVWHSVWHLTHLAAHSGDYSREEARYILGMGALALSLAANAPGVLKEASEGRDDAG